MAEATQIKFGLSELCTILIKQRGIREGKWIVMMDMSFGASLMGASPDQSFPTAIVQIPGIVLSAAPEGILVGTPGLVDAAIVNPVKQKKVPQD